MLVLSRMGAGTQAGLSKELPKWKTISRIIFLWLALSLISAYGLSASFKKRDDVITAQLQDMIAKNDLVKQAAITVTTENSIVKITGQAKNKAQAKMLVILADSIAGVDSIDASSLTYDGNKKLSDDDFITSQIIGIYIREGLRGINGNAGTNIQVNAKGGVVYLDGTVVNDDDAKRAEQFAREVPGVNSVASNLTVVTPQ